MLGMMEQHGLIDLFLKIYFNTRLWHSTYLAQEEEH